MLEDNRLQRIEEKLDKLADVVVGMARVEEKISDLETRRSESHERLNRVSARLDDVETGQATTNTKLGTIEKVMWFIAAGMLTGFGATITDLL